MEENYKELYIHLSKVYLDLVKEYEDLKVDYEHEIEHPIDNMMECLDRIKEYAVYDLSISDTQGCRYPEDIREDEEVLSIVERIRKDLKRLKELGYE